MNCKEISMSIEEIKIKRTELINALESDDVDNALVLRGEIISLIKELKDQLWLFEKLNKNEIKQQYNRQLEALRSVEIIETLSSGQEGYNGLEGKNYPLPSLEKIYQFLESDPQLETLIKKKFEQGFTEMRISPFFMPLSELIDKIDAYFLKLGGTIHSYDRWEKGKINQLKYFSGINSEGKRTEGKTKEEILQDKGLQSFLLDGYAISFIQSDMDSGRIGGRKKLDMTGRSPLEYLQYFSDKNSVYFGESSVLPEEWLCFLAESLRQHPTEENKPALDYSKFPRKCWFVDCVFPDSSQIPDAGWFHNSIELSIQLGSYGDGGRSGSLYPWAAIKKPIKGIK